jgi:hypothetical protein
MGKFRERKICFWWFRVIFLAGLVAGIIFTLSLESIRAQTIGVNPVPPPNPPPSSDPRQTLPGIPPPQTMNRIAFGVVNYDGKITQGSGFSVALTHFNNSTQYQVFFIPAFTTPPACVVTNNGWMGPIEAFYDISRKYLYVMPCDNGNHQIPGTFSFICVQ